MRDTEHQQAVGDFTDGPAGAIRRADQAVAPGAIDRVDGKALLFVVASFEGAEASNFRSRAEPDSDRSLINDRDCPMYGPAMRRKRFLKSYGSSGR
jgi:hypothetical protein